MIALSYNVVADPVHVNDLQATILHALGIDHRRLTIPFQGLDLKLTGVEDRNPVLDILAYQASPSLDQRGSS